MTDYHAIERDAGLARMRVCGEMAAELSAVTGDPWDVAEWRYRRDDCYAVDDPAGFRGAAFRRASDGFTIVVSGANDWKDKAKMRASILWPRRNEPGAAHSLYRDAPGVSYSAAEPVAKFSSARPVRQIAKQIARVLITPEHAAAFAGLIKMFSDADDRKTAAADWRKAVSAASGIEYRDYKNGESGGRWADYDKWCDLETSHDRPGGKLTIRLSDDAARAAAMVAAIRAIVESN